jgi:ferrochelatase
VKRALVLLTSAYSSYSGCRQYRENLAAAQAEVAADGQGAAPALERLRQYYDQTGFVEPVVDSVVAALEALATEHGDHAAVGAHLVFTTHSIPSAAADSSGPPGWFEDEGGAYVAQHRLAAGVVADAVAERTGGVRPWELVFQSRSGPPQQPWLEPDVSDHLRVLSEAGAAGAVLVPIGFISDHVEVLWDLDVVALADATALGLPCTRAGTVGTDPRFVANLRELVLERSVAGSPRPSRAPWGAMPDRCAPGCCPNPRGQRAALGDAQAAT